MMTKLRLALLATFLHVLAYTVSAQGTIQTDPTKNSNSFQSQVFAPFYNLTKTEPTAILPNVVKPFVPAGNYLDSFGTGTGGKPPDIGAVETIVVFLAQAFTGTTNPGRAESGNAGATGYRLWQLTLIGTVAGLLLSGLFVFRDISAGKLSISDGAMPLLGKTLFAMILFQYVCPNVPLLLIATTNAITQDISGWVSKAGAENPETIMIQSVYLTRVHEGAAQAQAIIYNIEDTIKNTYDTNDPRVKQILYDIWSDPELNDANNQNIGPDSSYQKDLNAILLRAKDQKTTWFDTNQAIGKAGTGRPIRAIKRLSELTEGFLAKMTDSGVADPVIKKYLLEAPRTLDLTATAWPSRAVTHAAFAAFVFMSLSIWGMGFASIIWVMLYSMPKEWDMGGILYAGFRRGLIIVLACAFQTIFIALSLTYQQDIIANSRKTMVTYHNYQAGAYAGMGGINWGTRYVTSEVDTDPTSNDSPKFQLKSLLTGDFMGAISRAMTGNTVEQYIIVILILGSGKIAAEIVKGANGIADTAKEAMNAGGASSRGFYGLIGASRSAGDIDRGNSTASSAWRKNICAPRTNQSLF
jgi:hypothetical protein